MNHEKIIIGALVGMGPNSTAIFYNKVMQYARTLYGAQYDNDFPHMILYSLPTPFNPNEKIDDQAMQKALSIGIHALNVPEIGIDYIVVPCNIVHKYYDKMQSESAVPILNIVTETIKHLPVSPQLIPVLATESTIESGIYLNLLEKQGYSIFHDSYLQNQINDLIKELKINNLSPYSRTQWQNIIDYLKNHACHTAVIACTDLSPCISLENTIKFIDSSDALAYATIEKYIELTKKLSSLT